MRSTTAWHGYWCILTKVTRMPKSWDIFDIEAEREGNARAIALTSQIAKLPKNKRTMKESKSIKSGEIKHENRIINRYINGNNK